jgi:hypothetical protein
MRQPDKTFRGKRLDAMSLPELKEMRQWVQANGYHYGSHQEHMEELAIIDEHIQAARRRLKP